MAAGYSLHLVRRVKAADKALLGVQLGRFCINNDIPVSDVAKRFGVTRASVYNWFAGMCNPHKSLHERITRYISE
jgi:predicted transcriptional regulator